MKNINLTVIQIVLFLIGAFIVFFSSDGTWESTTTITYIGMFICICAIIGNYLIALVEFIIDKWR